MNLLSEKVQCNNRVVRLEAHSKDRQERQGATRGREQIRTEGPALLRGQACKQRFASPPAA